MPYQIYKYFELITIVVLNKPLVLAKLVNKSALKRVKIPQVQKAYLDKNQR